MEKTLIAVYKKIGGNITISIESAFRKAIFLRLSNYLENGIYGIIFDLPDAPCYRSFCDSKIEEETQRCYDTLPQKYKDRFFIALRPRRYNIKQGKEDAFSCEKGVKGAFSELIEGKNEYLLLLGEIPSDFSQLYFSDSEGCLEAGGLNALIKIARTTFKNVFPSIVVSKTDFIPSKIDKKTNFFPFEINLLKFGNSFSAYEGLYFKQEKLMHKQEKNSLFIQRNVFKASFFTSKKWKK